MAALLQLRSDGLVRSFIDDQGNLRWALTDIGKTVHGLRAEGVCNEYPPAHQYNVGDVAMVEDVVSPAASGKLVVDIGPAVRMRLSDESVPNDVELGLLNVVLEEPQLLEDATPVYPRRVRMDIGMTRTRPRSKVTKEFEMVGCSVEFAGLFDLQGRLRCYSALAQKGAGECRAPRWTICPVVPPEDQGA